MNDPHISLRPGDSGTVDFVDDIDAMQCARSLEILVPEEISVMGFDDSELAMYSTPALSTVRISYQDEGVAAAEELFRRIEGGDR